MYGNISLKRQEIDERDLLGEKNDCTVRALMEVLEVPYMTAYGMMIGAGRKRNRGIKCNNDIFDRLCNSILPKPRMTVENYVKYIIHSGKYIVSIRGHVFAVIDGTIKDQWPNAVLNCHVEKTWKF